jgi:hypothetical protein
MKTPRTDLQANTYDFENIPLVKATGFREYDARWWFGGPQYPKAPELNFLGVQALGLGLGTLIREMGVAPRIVTGHDYRSYSLSIKQALTLGLHRSRPSKFTTSASPCRRSPTSPSSPSTFRASPWSPPATTRMAGPA